MMRAHVLHVPGGHGLEALLEDADVLWRGRKGADWRSFSIVNTSLSGNACRAEPADPAERIAQRIARGKDVSGWLLPKGPIPRPVRRYRHQAEAATI
jgi:hypothetical protein